MASDTCSASQRLPTLDGDGLYRLIVLDVYIHSLVFIGRVGGVANPYPTGLLLEFSNAPGTLIPIPGESELSMESLTLLRLGRPVTLLYERGVSLCLPVIPSSSPNALFTLLGGSEGDMETPLHLGTTAHPFGVALERCLGESCGPYAWQTVLTLKSLCGAIAQLTLTLKATQVPRDLEAFFSQQFAYSSSKDKIAASHKSVTLRPPPAGGPVEKGDPTKTSSCASAAAVAAASRATHPASRSMRWGLAELDSGSASMEAPVVFGPKGMLLSGVTVAPGLSQEDDNATRPPVPPWEEAPPQYHVRSSAPPAASLDDLLVDLIRLRDMVTGPKGGGDGATAPTISNNNIRGGSPGGPAMTYTGLGTSAAMASLQAALLETGLTQPKAAALVRTLSRIHIAGTAPGSWGEGQTVELGDGLDSENEAYLPFGSNPAMQRLAAWLPKSFSVLKSPTSYTEAASLPPVLAIPPPTSPRLVPPKGKGSLSTKSISSPRKSSSSPKSNNSSFTRSVTNTSGRTPPPASPLKSRDSSLPTNSSTAHEPVKGVRLPLALRARIAALAEERRFERESSLGGEWEGGENAASLPSEFLSASSNLTPRTPPRETYSRGSGVEEPPRHPIILHPANNSGSGGTGSVGSGANTPRTIPQEYLDMLEAASVNKSTCSSVRGGDWRRPSAPPLPPLTKKLLSPQKSKSVAIPHPNPEHNSPASFPSATEELPHRTSLLVPVGLVEETPREPNKSVDDDFYSEDSYSEDGPASSISGSAGGSASLLQVTRNSSGSGGSGERKDITALFVSALSPSPRKMGETGNRFSITPGKNILGEASLASLSASDTDIHGLDVVSGTNKVNAARVLESVEEENYEEDEQTISYRPNAAEMRAKAMAEFAKRRAASREVDDVPDSPFSPETQGGKIIGGPSARYFQVAEEEDFSDSDDAFSPPQSAGIQLMQQPQFTMKLESNGHVFAPPSMLEDDNSEESEDLDDF